jgi:predicted transcriptional regulator of viral defense system
MPGRIYNRLFDLAASQYGFVTLRDARALGVEPHRLAVMAQRGTLERAARGVYRFPAVPPSPLDEFMLATLCPRGMGVVSHRTALRLHRLGDVEATAVEVTVPARIRLRRAMPSTYLVHRGRLDPEDRTFLDGIPIVTPTRAILDGIDSGLAPEALDEAVEVGRLRGSLRLEDVNRIARAIARHRRG